METTGVQSSSHGETMPKTDPGGNEDATVEETERVKEKEEM
jgi:hypothetical protein